LSRRTSDPLDELAVALRSLTGHPTGRDDRRRFQQYLDLFLRWNQTYRMTALDSPKAIVHDLFIDSLLFLVFLPTRPLTLLDIGAGAGIPGLPLHLGLGDVVVKEGRVEALLDQEPDLAASFDVVVARSVGPAHSLLPLASKFLKPGGLFVASGPPDPLPQEGLEVVRVGIPGTRKSRAFLKAVKEG
jgi:16S rRNA G527 N7-methylase RsmG